MRPPTTRQACRLLVAVALSLAAAARAQENLMKPAAPAAAAGRFVKAAAFDLNAILPAPPAADSVADRAELQTVVQVTAARTPEQAAWARAMDKADAFALFGGGAPLGPEFTAERWPRLAALLKDINDDLRPVLEAAKKRHARPRPAVRDARIALCIDPPVGDAYPSGHGCTGYVRARVVAELFPEKRAALFERAAAFGWARVVAGVHYPSDVEGGRRIAEAAWPELLKSAAFRARLDECRAEEAAAGAK